jgi:hypothetical protein
MKIFDCVIDWRILLAVSFVGLLFLMVSNLINDINSNYKIVWSGKCTPSLEQLKTTENSPSYRVTCENKSVSLGSLRDQSESMLVALYNKTPIFCLHKVHKKDKTDTKWTCV